MFDRANSIFAIQQGTRQIGGNAMSQAALPNQSLHSDATAFCHLLHRALWISVLHPKSTLAVPPVSFVVRAHQMAIVDLFIGIIDLIQCWRVSVPLGFGIAIGVSIHIAFPKNPYTWIPFFSILILSVAGGLFWHLHSSKLR